MHNYQCVVSDFHPVKPILTLTLPFAVFTFTIQIGAQVEGIHRKLSMFFKIQKEYNKVLQQGVQQHVLLHCQPTRQLLSSVDSKWRKLASHAVHIIMKLH